MKRSPCKKDCPDRSATCHAECEPYLDFVRARHEERERIHKMKVADGYIHDAVKASKKSSRSWKGKI